MDTQETLFAMALTRISNFNFATALALYRELGSARAVYEHRSDIRDVVEALPGEARRGARRLA